MHGRNIQAPQPLSMSLGRSIGMTTLRRKGSKKKFIVWTARRPSLFAKPVKNG
jgi:hypothetical protein